MSIRLHLHRLWLALAKICEFHRPALIKPGEGASFKRYLPQLELLNILTCCAFLFTAARIWVVHEATVRGCIQIVILAL